MPDQSPRPLLWPFTVFPLAGIGLSMLIGVILWMTWGLRCTPGISRADACPLSPQQARIFLAVEFVGLPLLAVVLALGGYFLARQLFNEEYEDPHQQQLDDLLGNQEQHSNNSA